MSTANMRRFGHTEGTKEVTQGYVHEKDSCIGTWKNSLTPWNAAVLLLT
jgi:hypothetical protein